MQSISNQQQLSFESFNAELFSQFRRSVNSLKQTTVSSRKKSLQQILNMITKQSLPSAIYEQMGHLALKDFLKCLSDHSQACRELSTSILIQLLPRSSHISSFLPYIFSILIDRTNCHDLQGISNMPQKMRPPPGQKPKMLSKIIQPCQQIRILYCVLLKKIVGLLEHEDDIRKYLDDFVQVLRALIMDPCGDVQKIACQTMELLCKINKDLLLHYTEIMGRAVLLPLISKKSKIRIAGLKCLTAIFWCGLYKYNAFVFQNLIGFRDPNSVPIKDFYQPSHNINYLATFITDSNASVRLQFMKNLKIWICDLDDKYDHHGKIVPYIMSGLFDKDPQVQKTAISAIQQIGRQLEKERQKDFRQNKQFAIDAKWTWQGKLVQLPLTQPLVQRPSIGSRFFIRGHVRKFWAALYKEVKDINMDNRLRACNLAIYGCIYTENYLTQYLDNMIPHLLTCVIAQAPDQIKCCLMIQNMFYYIGRYCQQSSYLHIIKSALQGKLVQNEQFIKSGIRALSNIVKGSLQAIPGTNQGLFHKKTQIIQLFSMINETGVVQEIYNFNCLQIQSFIKEILKGLKNKASVMDLEEIFNLHLITMLRLWGVSYYQEIYVGLDGKEGQKKKHIMVSNGQLGNDLAQLGNNQCQLDKIIQGRAANKLEYVINIFGDLCKQVSQQYFNTLVQQYLSQVYQTPPCLMDSEWKLVVVLSNYLLQSQSYQQNQILSSLSFEIMQESINFNRSIQILNFCFKFIHLLLNGKVGRDLACLNNYRRVAQFMERCLRNFNRFKLQKKIPVYDQHLHDQKNKDSNIDKLKIKEETFMGLFFNASQTLKQFYAHKLTLGNSTLGKIIDTYVELAYKVKRSEGGTLESIKTLWLIFQREQVNQEFPKLISVESSSKQVTLILPRLINYLTQQLQILGSNPSQSYISMLFSLLSSSLINPCPIFIHAATPLPLIYPQYCQLYDKLIRYAMDQKDVELRRKMVGLLRKAVTKMRVWFQLEAKMAQQRQGFLRANFIQELLV